MIFRLKPNLVGYGCSFPGGFPGCRRSSIPLPATFWMPCRRHDDLTCFVIPNVSVGRSHSSRCESKSTEQNLG